MYYDTVLTTHKERERERVQVREIFTSIGLLLPVFMFIFVQISETLLKYITNAMFVANIT